MNNDFTVLVVDDEKDIRMFICGLLEDEGYKTIEAETVDSAIDITNKREPDLIILDIWLGEGDQDGLAVLDHTVKKSSRITPVIMISGHASVDLAVKTIKKGAYDFIEKPFKSDRLVLMAKRAIESANLKNENISLKKFQERSDKLNLQAINQNSPNKESYLNHNLKEARQIFEKDYIIKQIHKHDGNMSLVSQAIGMERTALYRKLKTLGIKEDK